MLRLSCCINELLIQLLTEQMFIRPTFKAVFAGSESKDFALNERVQKAAHLCNCLAPHLKAILDLAGFCPHTKTHKSFNEYAKTFI